MYETSEVHVKTDRMRLAIDVPHDQSKGVFNNDRGFEGVAIWKNIQSKTTIIIGVLKDNF